MQDIKDELYIGIHSMDLLPTIFHRDCPDWNRQLDPAHNDGVALFSRIFGYNPGACRCNLTIPETLRMQLDLLTIDFR